MNTMRHIGILQSLLELITTRTVYMYLIFLLNLSNPLSVGK